MTDVELVGMYSMSEVERGYPSSEVLFPYSILTVHMESG